MHHHRLLTVLVLSVTLLLSALAIASEPPKATAKNPSIEGTYRLVTRTLPDGTKMTSPDIIGLLTFTKTHRNFNIVWKQPDGKKFSLSIVSTYKLTDKDYTETLLYVLQNDEITGKGLTYDFSGQSKTVPISMSGGSIKIKLPFDPATVTFSGNKIIGVAESMFTDDWEKIQ
ncbi:MAG: hypothetical protein NT028_13315 [candidate division Zixibacteria bacterium]|nr:hypothetical protein [candidate division Zixibacteria bacterium]